MRRRPLPTGKAITFPEAVYKRRAGVRSQGGDKEG